MSSRDPVLTPDLVRILKIFIFSSFGLMLLLSFFNSHRANNSGKDRTFKISDADKLYFLNVRSIHYDRELRRDAGMTLFRHENRSQLDSFPQINPVIILNPVNGEAYIFFELENADFPVRIAAKSGQQTQMIEFANGNNSAHFDLMKSLKPLIDKGFEFFLISANREIPLWNTSEEKEILKTIFEDYFRLLNQFED
jgi:hypothetical protein